MALGQNPSFTLVDAAILPVGLFERLTHLGVHERARAPTNEVRPPKRGSPRTKFSWAFICDLLGLVRRLGAGLVAWAELTVYWTTGLVCKLCRSLHGFDVINHVLGHGLKMES